MTQDMIKDFKKRWKINEQYWYPLVKYESEYNDVISLDLNLLIENSMLSYLCRLLETKRLDEVFELRENGQLIVHSVMVDLEETLKSDYYWMNEGY